MKPLAQAIKNLKRIIQISKKKTDLFFGSSSLAPFYFSVALFYVSGKRLLVNSFYLGTGHLFFLLLKQGGYTSDQG